MKTLRSCGVALLAACAVMATVGCSSGGTTNTAPSAPTGVTATGGNVEVTISWSAVTGATSYNVYWSTTTGVTPANGARVSAGANSQYEQFVLANGTTYYPLTNGTTYYYVVTAVGPGGESGPSAQVSAVPTAAAVGPYIYASVFTLVGGGELPYFNFTAVVFVCTDGYSCNSPFIGATVTVNGAALTYDSSTGGYYDTGNVTIAEGATVTVDVTLGQLAFSFSGTQFTSPPTITDPASSPANWTAANANTIAWTGGAPTTGAAAYFAQLSAPGYVFPPSSQSGELPITQMSLTVPAATLTAGSALQLLVGIVSPGAIFQDSGGIYNPNTGAGSGLWLGVFAPAVTVNTQ